MFENYQTLLRSLDILHLAQEGGRKEIDICG